MHDDSDRRYCCIHAAIAAAADERRRGLPPVVTPDEYLELDRRASQRHEYVDGVTYPKEYPPRSFERARPARRDAPAHARVLDYCWRDARGEREVNAERWRALLIDARDWGCDLDEVRSALMELAGIVAQFSEWEERVRRLWSPAAERPIDGG